MGRHQGLTAPPFLETLAARFRAPKAGDRLLQITHGFDRLVGGGGGVDGHGIESALDRLVESGVGGIVTNVAFSDYLRSPAEWEVLRLGVALARTRGLAVWIYDEEGYPSGAAGGLVLEGHPELEAFGLACRTFRVRGPRLFTMEAPDCPARFVAAVAWNDRQTLDLASAAGPSGDLRAELPPGAWTVQIFFEKPAYEGTHAERNVHASRRYINVLDPRAAARFLEVTHAAYARVLCPDLGGARAFFTDEPSLMSAYVWPLPPGVQGKTRVQDPLRSTDRTPMVAWSRDFPEEFRRRAGYRITDHLPDLFVDRGPRSRQVREDYRAVAGAVFADAYFGTIGDWCAAHGVASTGHVLVEESLLWHVAFLGDLFAAVRRMRWPGIDMLDADPASIVATEGFMVARQVSSAAHLEGRTEVVCEASDWLMRTEGRVASPEQMRGTANLLYLLGVTIIASYYDAAMPSYPAYTLHAARLRTLLTAGRHDAHVAVVYPVRSVQGRYLPQSDPPLPPSQPEDLRAIVAGWTAVCRVLLERQVDFDCIDERGLAEGRVAQGALHAGAESYDLMVVPPADRLGTEALGALARLADAGGRVVIVGDPSVPPLEGVAAHPRVTLLPDVAALALAVGGIIAPTLRVEPARRDIFCARHLLPTGPLYFVVNNARDAASCIVSLPVSGTLRIWDPGTGGVSSPAPYAAGSPVPLSLDGFSSLFLSLA